MIKSIKKVSITKRKDPLIDFNTLMTIGRHASRSAREKALSHGQVSRTQKMAAS